MLFRSNNTTRYILFLPFMLCVGYGGREVRSARILLNCQACELLVRIPPTTINKLFSFSSFFFLFFHFSSLSFLFFTFLLYSFFPIQLYLKNPEIISTESLKLSNAPIPWARPDFFVIVIQCLYDMNAQLYAKAQGPHILFR